MNNMKSCNVTGHRKITPQGYVGRSWWAPTCHIIQQYHGVIKQGIMSTVLKLYQDSGVVEFVSGGAIGADILFAEVIIELRDTYKYPITLGIAKPFPSHSSKWNHLTTTRYNNVLHSANWVYTVSPDPYSARKMYLRNEWMVNRSGILLALWGGMRTGGTWNCMNYAHNLGRIILTINV